MKIACTKINSYIYHVRFQSRYDLTSTLLRFGESIESPEFKGKRFTLRQFKKWYKASHKNKFTYYEDWSGYNVPSKELKPFRDGRFNPLSKKEKQFLKLFNGVKGEFYVIATFSRNRTEKETLRHEMIHATFSHIKKYREKVKKYFKKNKHKQLRDFILKDYSKSVLVDEMNAYLVNDFKWLKCKGIDDKCYIKYSRDLKKLYSKYKDGNRNDK